MNLTKQILFTDTFGAGGISTNVVALASYFTSPDDLPIIVPLSSVKHGTGVWEFSSKIAKIYTVWTLIKFLMMSKRSNYVFFVNSARTLLVAYFIFFLSLQKKHAIKIVFCVYHPSEFSATGYWCSIYRWLVCTVGPKNIFFMNGACFAEHSAMCSADSVESRLLPLAIPNYSVSNHKLLDIKKRSILTVGRFVGFKLHYMRALLRCALIRPEYNFYFAGYGDGAIELEAFVKDNKLNNVVFLGNVEYAKLNSLYEDAACYVGMGTTLVEAASAGTPCIVAIAGMPGDVCYGFFVNQTEYDMGEFRKNKPVQSLTGCIDHLLTLDSEESILISKQHRDFSKKFGVDVIGPVYLRLCESANETYCNFKAVAIWCGFIVATVVYYSVWMMSRKKSRYDKSYL